MNIFRVAVSNDRPFSIHLTYGLEEIDEIALVQLEKDVAKQQLREKQRITRREALSRLSEAVQSGKLQRIEVRNRLAAAIQAGKLRGIFGPERSAVSTVIDLLGSASRPSRQ